MTTEIVTDSAWEDSPVFGQNFEEFVNFLNAETSPLISPERFGLVFKVDMQTIAARAHIPMTTFGRVLDPGALQCYLRESVRVTQAASGISGSVEAAVSWFNYHPLRTFEHKAPWELVSEKRTEALIKYIEALQAGSTG